MSKFTRILFLLLTALLINTQAQAGLLDLTLNQNGKTASKSFDSILDLAEFDEAELEQILTGFQMEQDANLYINYRGVPLTATTNNGVVTVIVDETGEELFRAGTSGGTNKAALDALADQFMDNPTSIIDTINKIAVEHTPFDPVAGNPSSFLYRMQDSSYNAAAYNYTFRPNLSIHNIEKTTTLSNKDVINQEIQAMSLNVPIGFNVNFSQNTGLTIDIPVTATMYDGSLAADISVGATWRQGILNMDKFEIGVAAGGRAGVAGSLDLGTAGIIWNVHGSLLSKYILNDAISFRMVNHLGYYNAPPVDLSSLLEGIDIRVPYDFTAIGLKNSIAVNYHFTEQVFAQLAFIDTRFLSFDQYISYYEEIRLSFEYDRGEGGFFEDAAIYAGYKFGEKNYNGFEVGFGLNF